MPNKVKLIPLGGLGEVGKNMMVLESADDMILIDTGLMFPDDEMLGIDLVLPDFTYVRENRDKLRAILLTHGHEDHTGALPYVLREIKVPVYGTKLTLGLVEAKLTEHRLLKESELREIQPGDRVTIGAFHVEFIQVCHSIPDGVGLAIRTPVGTIVHTGDFKFDQSPIDGRLTDFARFGQIGQEEDILALLSDSTRAEIPGTTDPERGVGHVLEEIFREAKQRIVVACFASHIHRVQQIIDAAVHQGRKVAVAGRSLQNSTEIASRLGYLQIPKGLLINVRELSKHPPQEVLVLSTGSQGEPMSALSRMASRDHKHVQIEPGDTVIISATPVPGNEKSVSRTINQLFKCGADVHYEAIAGVHASGHASIEELKTMINLVKPKYFIPIHGEMRQLVHHAEIAQYLGIPDKRILLAENGDVVEFHGRRQGRINKRVQSGVIFVDGLGVGDIGNIVLRDRQLLSRDGIAIVVMSVDNQTGELLSGPDIICRGFVYVKESGQLIEGARERVFQSFEKSAKDGITDWGILKSHVRDVLSRYFYEETLRRPMVIPIIMEV